MKLEEVIIQDTRANQPLATAVPLGTLYGVTDEGNIIERSDGTAWQAYSPTVVASGLDQLTGDVTAGPGSGSQVATIPNNTIVTAKIIDDAVTYAKMQNVSAISKLLGRGAAAGAGNPEEITLGTGLTMTGTTLDASGGGGGGGFVYLGVQTAAASAALNFVSLITSTYNIYQFELENVVPATNATELRLQVSVDNGANWITTGYKWAFVYNGPASPSPAGSASTSSTHVFVAGSISNVAGNGVNGTVKVNNPLSLFPTPFYINSYYLHSDTNRYNFNGTGWYDANSAINAIRFIMDSGNISTGVIRMYGYAKS